MNKECLWCHTDLDESNYSGGKDGYQFCDECVHNLEVLEVDLEKAEQALRKFERC